MERVTKNCSCSNFLHYMYRRRRNLDTCKKFFVNLKKLALCRIQSLDQSQMKATRILLSIVEMNLRPLGPSPGKILIFKNSMKVSISRKKQEAIYYACLDFVDGTIS